jgi:acetyltransferase-like isoleucine patch superfamily enzyme
MSIRSTIDKGLHYLLALWYLRRCTSLGARPRVYGRPRILNMGEIHIGDRFLMFNQTVRSELVSQPGGQIEIGDGVFLNYGVSITAHQQVSIGKSCQIGSYVCMMDNDYHRVEDRSKPGVSAPIILKENAWLGVRAIVLKGVTIGRNSVVGAGGVVTRDVPSNCLVAGVPAEVIRRFEPEEEAGEIAGENQKSGPEP